MATSPDSSLFTLTMALSVWSTSKLSICDAPMTILSTDLCSYLTKALSTLSPF